MIAREAQRDRMADQLQKGIDWKWYEWPVWYVSTHGSYPRQELLTEWSLTQVLDAYFDLRILNLLES